MMAPLVPESNQGRPSLGVMSDSGQSREQSHINIHDDITSSSRLSVEEDFGLDIDLSPQLNLALREEVRFIYFISKFICLFVWFVCNKKMILFIVILGSSFYNSWYYQIC